MITVQQYSSKDITDIITAQPSRGLSNRNITHEN